MIPSYNTVPIAFGDEKTHRRLLAEAANRHNNAKFNCTASLTLNASATTTTLTDARLTAFSVLCFMPLTANAATAHPTIYVTNQGSGTATINHASTADIDKNFTVGIFS